jgi:hypothetical protein
MCLCASQINPAEFRRGILRHFEKISGVCALINLAFAKPAEFRGTYVQKFFIFLPVNIFDEISCV